MERFTSYVQSRWFADDADKFLGGVNRRNPVAERFKNQIAALMKSSTIAQPFMAGETCNKRNQVPLGTTGIQSNISALQSYPCFLRNISNSSLKLRRR